MQVITLQMLARTATAILLAAAWTCCARAATYGDLNKAFGFPVWQDDNLWDDADTETARRFDWPEESRTTTDSSFRKYPAPSEVVLGTRPYSLALYGGNGLVSSVSMMFANKGDAVDCSAGPLDAKEARARQKAIGDFQAEILADKKTIVAALTSVLGEPAADRFGQGSQTREQVKRWDWNGHAILLASPRDEYAAVRIVPVAVADTQGKSRIPDTELRARLASRIEHRPNGDVVLKDIPMVDQGPKGYCVPATWERVMRYMAIPADMYVLAMAGNTEAGGGTGLAAIAQGAKEAIMRGGRQFASEPGKITISNTKKCINRGLPIMWAVFVDRNLDHELSARTKERALEADPKAWTEKLSDARKAARKIRNDPASGHLRMIIGYNDKTNEIAFSDSWGPRAAERWMTEEEAQAISQGGFQYINF